MEPLSLKDLQDRTNWFVYYDTKPEDFVAAPVHYTFAKNPWTNKWAILEIDGYGYETVIAEHSQASTLIDQYNKL